MANLKQRQSQKRFRRYFPDLNADCINLLLNWLPRLLWLVKAVQISLVWVLPLSIFWPNLRQNMKTNTVTKRSFHAGKSFILDRPLQWAKHLDYFLQYKIATSLQRKRSREPSLDAAVHCDIPVWRVFNWVNTKVCALLKLQDVVLWECFWLSNEYFKGIISGDSEKVGKVRILLSEVQLAEWLSLSSSDIHTSFQKCT